MKKVLLAFATILTLSTTAVQAQKIGAGAFVSFARMTGDLGANSGFGFSYGLEGKYFLKPRIAVGLRYQETGVVYKDEGNALDFGVYGNTQYTARGEYFFLTGKFRPFAGLGIGLSSVVTPEITMVDAAGNESVVTPEEKRNNFGIVPSAGFMIGNFGLEANFNVAGKTPKSTAQNVNFGNKSFNFYNISAKYIYTF